MAWTFVSPFGVVKSSTSQKNTIVGRTSTALCPGFATASKNQCWLSLLPLSAKPKDEDDDWEPNEEDLLNDIEDMDGLVDDDDDIEDDSMLIVGDDIIEEDDEDEEIEVDDIWADDEFEDEDTIIEEYEEEEEGVSSYLGAEVEYEDEDWDEDEGHAFVPLQDDPDDPDYQAQKKLVEETVARREQVAKEKDFDPIAYMMNEMTPEQAKAFESHPLQQETDKLASQMVQLEDADVENLDLEKEMEATPDLMYDDPYEDEGEENIFGTGVSDNELKQLDKAYKNIQDSLKRGHWDKVDAKARATHLDHLDNQTLYEMDACLEEIGGSAYNSTRWLLYDLDFNVSNLILAAIQHNPQAPILFQHWYPQLVTYERYKHARDRDFDFDWDDVKNADISELERYYEGFGYNKIPEKAPAETGIISLEDLDEEEIKMAAFENWMIDVYNEEWDKKDFDDDDFRDEDNVFSDYFEMPDHPDLPTLDDALEDIAEFDEEIGDDPKDLEYKNLMGQEFKYQHEKDEEFEREFRGHLVVACTPEDSDLEIAEKITARMDKEFGKQIFVETRVMAHAREEDCVFEVWLESYEIDLLHSKKRASSNAEGWDGPADCDDQQIDHLVDEVRFLISDDARYNYRYELDMKV